MLTTIIIFSFFGLVNSFSVWDFPIDVNLTMNTYNSTNCNSNISIHTEFVYQCENTTILNTTTGFYHQCCFDMLKRLSPIVDPKFNHCYTSPNTYNNTNHYKYLCEKTEMYNLTIMQIIVFLFIIVILIFCVCFVLYCIKQIFTKHRNNRYKYHRIN